MINIINSKKNISTKNKIAIYFGIYTICFLICYLSFFGWFIKYDKSFIWRLDGEPVLYPEFEYAGGLLRSFIRSVVKNGTFCLPQYDFRLGMGKSILHYIGNWYVEPLALLRMFVPYQYTPLLYNIFVVVRLYLVGVSFSIFSIYKKNDKFSTLIGALVYVFSFYTLYSGTKYPVFLVPMIYLPIMLVGLDILMEKHDCRLFIFMIFLSAWTHYYYLVINTMFLAAYFFVEFIFKKWSKEQSIKKVFSDIKFVIFSYIIGIFMSAVVFFPNVLIFINSNRSGATINVKSLLHYGYDYYKKLWLYLGFPCPSFSIGYEAFLGIIPIACLAIIYVLFLNRKYNKIKVYLVLALCCLLIPFASFGLCGFSNINNRWIYGFIFVISYCVTIVLPQLCKKNKLANSIIILLILLYGVGLFSTFESDKNEYTLCCIFLLVAFFSAIIYGQNKCEFKLKFATLIMIIFSVFLFGYYVNNPRYMNYTNQFVENNEIRTIISDTPSKNILYLNDDEFYRVDEIETNRSNLASALLNNYQGVSDYSNVLSKDFSNTMLDLENAGYQESIINYDFDGRTILDSLAAVKYISCTQNMESYLPYGYSLILKSTLNNGTIINLYKNELNLPIGYTYNSYITESDYSNLNYINKQEALLDTVVLEQELDGYPKVKEDGIVFCGKQVSSPQIHLDNIQNVGDEYIVLEGGGSIEVQFQGEKNAETYLRFRNINMSQNNQYDWTWRIDNGSGNCKELFLMNDNNYYRPNTHNYTVNLGYSEEARKSCKIYIPTSGVFSVDDIEIWVQDFSNYDERIHALSEDILENVEINNNIITGDITAQSDKILCLSILYDKGWSVWVDGKQSQIYKANGMYMAVPITKGFHQIELRYTIPGIKVGIVFSILFIIIYILYLIFYQKNLKREKCCKSGDIK